MSIQEPIGELKSCSCLSRHLDEADRRVLLLLYPFQFRCVDSTAAGVAAAAAFAEICLQSSEANSGTQPGGTKKIHRFQYTELLYSSVFIF